MLFRTQLLVFCYLTNIYWHVGLPLLLSKEAAQARYHLENGKKINAQNIRFFLPNMDVEKQKSKLLPWGWISKVATGSLIRKAYKCSHNEKLFLVKPTAKSLLMFLCLVW